MNIPLVKRLVDRSVEVKVTDVMWAGVCRAVKAAIVVAFKERRGTAKPQEVSFLLLQHDGELRSNKGPLI